MAATDCSGTTELALYRFPNSCTGHRRKDPGARERSDCYRKMELAPKKRCETNPKIRPGAIENAVSRKKTNPNEPNTPRGTAAPRCGRAISTATAMERSNSLPRRVPLDEVVAQPPPAAGDWNCTDRKCRVGTAHRMRHPHRCASHQSHPAASQPVRDNKCEWAPPTSCGTGLPAGQPLAGLPYGMLG
jgi:hypothetical protein